MTATNTTGLTTPASVFLASPEIRERLHRLSLDDYHRLGEQGIIGERTELIRGVVIDKMSKSPLHAWLTSMLYTWLDRGVGDGWTVRSELPVTLKTSTSEPEPDVCVVRGSLHDYRKQHPTDATLAIEIAVSSEKLDREKALIYAEAGLQEYWLVLAEGASVEVYREPADGQYRSISTHKVGDTLSPLAFPELTMPVAELFPADE